MKLKSAHVIVRRNRDFCVRAGQDAVPFGDGGLRFAVGKNTGVLCAAGTSRETYAGPNCLSQCAESHMT